MSHFTGMSTLALDLAIEIDRAGRGLPATLVAARDLAARLQGVVEDDDPCEVLDLLQTIDPETDRPRTVDDLRIAIDGRAAMLRGIADGNTPDLRDGLDYCLALHRMLLARDSRGWWPLGLAA